MVLGRWERGERWEAVVVALRASQRRGKEETQRDANRTEEGRERERGLEREESSEGARENTRTQGLSVFSFAWDECDRHANCGQHSCPPDPGTQPSHGPQGHQAGARTGGVGLGVCPDTTQTPLPCLSLGRHPLSHSGTEGWGGEPGVGARVPGQRRRVTGKNGPQGSLLQRTDPSVNLLGTGEGES